MMCENAPQEWQNVPAENIKRFQKSVRYKRADNKEVVLEKFKLTFQKQCLWNEVLKIEKSSDAQLGRSFEFSLPKEWNRQEQIEYTTDYIQKNFVDKGMCADWSIHDKGDGNPHVHLLVTMRPFNPDHSWGNKEVKAKWIIVGVLLPVIVKAVYLFFFSGKYVSSGMNSNQIFSTLSAGIAFTGIAAGFVEEMVFRGVILNLLKEKWNIKVAVLIPSVLFGLVHIIGMDFSIISSLLVLIAGTMVGIMFSMVAIESGSVWNSGIVHSLWNILIIGGGLSISEKADEYSVMTYVLDSKDFVFTGGEFGIESSIIALLGYVIVTLAAICMIKKKAKV